MSTIGDNYVPKGDGSAISGLDQSVIYDDGTNVGIGTTGPSKKLVTCDTAPDGGTIQIKKTDSGTANQNGHALNFVNLHHDNTGRNAGVSAGNILWQFSQPTSGAAQNAAKIDVLSDAYQSGLFTYSALTFWTTDASGGTLSERMRICFGGNVGIGCTDPGTKLEVYDGNIRLRKTDAYPQLELFNYSHDNASLNFDCYYNSGWKSSDAGSNFRIYKIGDKLRIGYYSGVNAGSALSDWDGAGGENNKAAIVIDTSGRVGIGVTSPGSNLEIKGNLITALPSLATSSGTGNRTISCNNHGLVAGDAVKLPSGASGAFEVFSVASTSGNYFDVDSDLSNAITNAQGYCDPVQFKITSGDSATLFAIDKSGYVGIGTASPQSPVDVRGSGYGSSLISVVATGGSRACIYGMSDTGVAVEAGCQGAGYGVKGTSYDSSGTGGYFANVDAGGIALQTGTGKVYLQGNVGIATTSPGEKLDVAGNVKSSGQFMLGNIRIGAGSSNPTSAEWKYKGSLHINTTDGKLYINTASDGSGPTWTVVGSQS